MGRRALPLQMDMRSMEQIRSAVDKTAKEFGRIDILVNNAGIAPENWLRMCARKISTRHWT